MKEEFEPKNGVGEGEQSHVTRVGDAQKPYWQVKQTYFIIKPDCRGSNVKLPVFLEFISVIDLQFPKFMYLSKVNLTFPHL